MMHPTFRPQLTKNWIVNITPSRVDSLPYSKIKSLLDKYWKRLLIDSRSPNPAPTAVPPAAIFICQPTPSYVLSPQVAAELTRSDIWSLKSNLRVYQRVPTRNNDSSGNSLGVKELDCTPECFVDKDLSGNRALYYGHGQIHVVGMIDFHKARVRTPAQFYSSESLHNRLAEEVSRGLPLAEEVFRGLPSRVTDPFEDHESWLLHNNNAGLERIARVAANVADIPGIATASITLNLAVPTQGLDPDRTCPHVRLAAAGVETGRFTSIWAGNGRPASDQSRTPHVLNLQDLCVFSLIRAVQRAMGLKQIQTFVDPTRAFDEHDPDLEPDKDAERIWPARERRRRNEELERTCGPVFNKSSNAGAVRDVPPDLMKKFLSELPCQARMPSLRPSERQPGPGGRSSIDSPRAARELYPWEEDRHWRSAAVKRSGPSRKKKRVVEDP